MKVRALSIIIALALISIVGIGSVQYFWFKKAFDLKEKQFNQSVLLSLQSVGEAILNYNQITIPDENLVEQISGNYYVVHTNAEIDLKILEHLIRGEFEKRSIFVDFEYGVYDCFDDKLIIGNYVNMSQDEEDFTDEEVMFGGRNIPQLENDAQYFGVYFPAKDDTLMGQMGIWLFSTIVLLFVFTFFGVSIFILFRQKRLSEMQKDFVNNMTHEFKTPLYTIMVTSDLLKQPAILKEEQSVRSYLDIITQEAQRLKLQIERVLHIASSDKGKLPLQIEAINMHNSISKACNAAASLLQSKKGTIKFQLDASKYMLKGDKMHIENVIYNLIENAIKYTDKQPEINISTYNDNQSFVVKIEDNGIGIATKDIPNIFKKFYRVPTGNTHNVKGFGLGLSYVKDIVKAHRGSIHVTSEMGKGSIFQIELPI